MTTAKCDLCGERYQLTESYTHISVDFNGQPHREDIALDLCPDCGLMLLRDVRTANDSGQDSRWASP